MNKFYLTSAIPYVNAAPHIGHAQEFVYSDTIRRFHTLKGDDVFYLCGADENALKIVQAAEKANMDPQTFCDEHNKEFLNLSNKLNVHFDKWQRGTNTKTHFPSAQTLWSLCAKNDDIYKKSYEGLYCVGCEAFYTKDELDDKGECFEHPGRKLEKISEVNYFFKLSKYQDFLFDLITTDTLKITPEFRKNEALGFIKKGLEDFSISRSKIRAKGWGVPVPEDSEQIMYVWFDALNIYQSGIGFGWDDKEYKKWAPQDVMVIGKGIIRFHAIYWPAILKSAGLSIPKALFAHGYLTVDGQKMSKTLGNVIDPVQLIDKFGTDPLRFYLLREIPSARDGDYSQRRFQEVYNADLANGLGNLVSRIARLSEKISVTQNKKITFSTDVSVKLEQYKFDEAISVIWDKIKHVDKYIDENKPWKITDTNQLEKILNTAIKDLTQIAFDLQPFLPQTAQKILDQFQGPRITASTPLFPRIT